MNSTTSQKELTVLPQTPPPSPEIKAPETKAPEIVVTSADATKQRPLRHRRYTYPTFYDNNRCYYYDRNAYKRELDLQAYSKSPSSTTSPIIGCLPSDCHAMDSSNPRILSSELDDGN